LALLAGTSCLPAAAATDLSAYLVLTTDYVWRGVTQSDGDPAAQLGAEVTFGNGIHVGLWGSTVDIDNGANRQRDTEVIYYAGFAHDLDSRWTLGVNLVAYTYPGQSGPVDYDYEELVVSANFRDRTWFEYAYSPDLYNTGADSHNAEIYTEWPAGKHLVVGAGAGYYDVSDVVGTGYGYWELGVTWPIGRFDLDFRYYDTNRSVPIISSNDRAASRVALTVRISF
jgi:uncharacterized protein (TIGR02001 family)